VSHVPCDPRHGARTVDALPASVYNHTVARPDLRLRAPDPATFSRIIDSLTLCPGRAPDCPEDLVTEMTGGTQTSIEPRRKKHQGDYYPVSRHRPRTQGTHLSYG